MDKSKEYILMCEKAPKELWDKVEHYGSFIVWRYFIGIVMLDLNKTKWEGLASMIPETLVLRTWLKEGEETIIVLNTNISYGGLHGDKGTPLYRQDQLQEILDFETYELLDICAESDGIMWEALHDYADSMEQLWLAFVMKEKYQKVWNGKDWIKEK